MLNNKLNFIACDCEYKKADIVIFGAPFDGTTSFRPGTRFAPNAIRLDSIGIETYSPYTDRDLIDYKICDIGDVDIPIGNTKEALKAIAKTSEKILKDNKIPVMIGGEHLVTLPVIEQLYKKYGDFCIIHFDAHTDLRDDYLGVKLSHASVMRRAWEILGDGKIFHFGIRSGEKNEFEFAREHNYINSFNLDSISEIANKLIDKKVYISLDLDVLDPSIFPGTGTPEPGGVTFKELIDAILKLNKLNIIGFDINELSPHYDHSGVSTAVACKLLRELLLVTGGSING